MSLKVVVPDSSISARASWTAWVVSSAVNWLSGNVQTRLSKLDNGEYDAIILAAAGLQRLELNERIRLILSEADSLPAAVQGALVIEIATHCTDLLGLLAAALAQQVTHLGDRQPAVDRKSVV